MGRSAQVYKTFFVDRQHTKNAEKLLLGNTYDRLLVSRQLRLLPVYAPWNWSLSILEASIVLIDDN